MVKYGKYFLVTAPCGSTGRCLPVGQLQDAARNAVRHHHNVHGDTSRWSFNPDGGNLFRICDAAHPSLGN
jgi:hypothetical protein